MFSRCGPGLLAEYKSYRCVTIGHLLFQIRDETQLKLPKQLKWDEFFPDCFENVHAVAMCLVNQLSP